MGLLGMAARTAVVAGTATAVSGRVARRQNARYQEKAEAQAYEDQQQQQQYAPEPQPAPQYAPPPPQYVPAPAPAAAAPDITAELQKLGDLKAQGILSDAEFSAAKAKLLGL